MTIASDLRRRAERYRRLGWQITDAAAERAAEELANELETTAAQMERRLLIREGAHAMWVEHDQPPGRDLEFWIAAEREVDTQRRR